MRIQRWEIKALWGITAALILAAGVAEWMDKKSDFLKTTAGSFTAATLALTRVVEDKEDP